MQGSNLEGQVARKIIRALRVNRPISLEREKRALAEGIRGENCVF